MCKFIRKLWSKKSVHTAPIAIESTEKITHIYPQISINYFAASGVDKNAPICNSNILVETYIRKKFNNTWYVYKYAKVFPYHDKMPYNIESTKHILRAVCLDTQAVSNFVLDEDWKIDPVQNRLNNNQ